jgi:galactokinase
VSGVCSIFENAFSSSSDSVVTLGFVPGRIEIAGKHTDYAGGHTLVCAIEKGFLFVAGANTRGTMRIIEDSSEFTPVEFPLSADIQSPAGSWANYPMTMAQRLADNFGKDRPLSGVDIAFACDMPVGSGMSGSSALMIMCFCAIETVNKLRERASFRENVRSGIDLAMYLACVENGQSFGGLPGGRGVGTFGGSEDHTAILNCREGDISLYQYAPTVFKADAAWPQEWALAVAFSGVRAEKTREALEKYNLASRRASLAVDAYGRSCNPGKKLRVLADIEAETRSLRSTSWLKGLENATLDLQGRVRQFLLEERKTTPEALRAVAWRDLAAFGAVINESHRASRRFLRNITPEIDYLQKAAVRLGAAGATGFGAGFGGSIFAVIQADKAAEFVSGWSKEYAKRYPARAPESVFFQARPSSGIRVWEENKWTRLVDTFFGA